MVVPEQGPFYYRNHLNLAKCPQSETDLNRGEYSYRQPGKLKLLMLSPSSGMAIAVDTAGPHLHKGAINVVPPTTLINGALSRYLL